MFVCLFVCLCVCVCVCVCVFVFCFVFLVTFFFGKEIKNGESDEKFIQSAVCCLIPLLKYNGLISVLIGDISLFYLNSFI